MIGFSILVTGATGFIGSYIVAAALSFGYRVRGTVRSDGKAAVSHKTHGNNLKYTTAVVPDVAAPSAFDGASKDVHGVVHVASNMSFNNDPAKVIPGVKRATLSVLEAAARTPSVTRVVLTSSSTAATMPKPETRFYIDKQM